jgi:hypothetical protein
VGTINVIEKYGLQQTFIDMNASLPLDYQREHAVKLCDEIMYVIGFAGMGGTSACVETVGQFLQVQLPGESASDAIDFGDYDTPEKMIAAYRANPLAYIMESSRLDPPVTSATHVLKEDATVSLAGKEFDMPAGTLSQYVVSMANRDESVFPNPELFDPTRRNLSSTLTWNGCFGTPNEEQVYPRICPGRYLSVDVTKAIVGHALSRQGM